MFISKVAIDKSAIQRKPFFDIFGSGYTIHQAVWDFFADDPSKRRDFLYRVESDGKLPVIYILSKRKPEDKRGVWKIDTKIYEPKIKDGMKLKFTIRVNPTCKKNGNRHDVVMDFKKRLKKSASKDEKKKTMADMVQETCGKWINERSKKYGFVVLKAYSDGYRQVKFYKPNGRKHIQYSVVDITGALEVTESQTFKNMLISGLGHEKGFGCGLMLVRKI